MHQHLGDHASRLAGYNSVNLKHLGLKGSVRWSLTRFGSERVDQVAPELADLGLNQSLRYFHIADREHDIVHVGRREMKCGLVLPQAQHALVCLHPSGKRHLGAAFSNLYFAPVIFRGTACQQHDQAKPPSPLRYFHADCPVP